MLCVCVELSVSFCFPPHSNGLLIDHYLCEVNGQNVIGVKDKGIAKIFSESPRTVTITIMPKFVYDHLMKKSVQFASAIYNLIFNFYIYYIYVTVHAKTLRKSAILISSYGSRRHERQFILFSRFFAHKVRIPS